MERHKKPELLSPAGNLEKLKCAVVYGADAVYLGGKEFSLRAAADNFSVSDIKKGVDFAHKRDVKVYAALNIFARNKDFASLLSYVDELCEARIDAIIVADPGIFKVVRERVHSVPIFMSVQASITNLNAVLFWKELGANRVTLARELTLSEIKKITSAADIDTEVFIHGAMCISYSGRCLLSKYLEGRDANRGECTQCCRWKYYLLEEKRVNEYYPIFEDDRGTYIFSSRDLCLLRVLPDLISTGVSSLKIEGRMKSVHYVSVITRIYREAIDKYFEDSASFSIDPIWEEELTKVSHRAYTEGFATEQTVMESWPTYLKKADFVGLVMDSQHRDGPILIEVRNKICEGETLEAFLPTGKSEKVIVKDLRRADDGSKIETAHANYKVYLSVRQLPEFSILRRVVG